MPTHNFNKEQLNTMYWDQWLSQEQMAQQLGVHRLDISDALKAFGIPQRVSESSRKRTLVERNGHVHWNIHVNGKPVPEHRYIVENELGLAVPAKSQVHHKDGNCLNNHPLNLVVLTQAEGKKLNAEAYARLPWFFNHMVHAYLIAHRSSCARLSVGCVITSFDLDQVYAFGLNGNAKQLKNDCDSPEPGRCGCVHAEANALIKCSERDKTKIVFATHSPCLACAKLLINSGVSYVFYGKAYRDTTPLQLLHHSGVRTCPYPIVFEPDQFGGVKIERVPPSQVIQKAGL